MNGPLNVVARTVLVLLAAATLSRASPNAPARHTIYVTNERSGDVSVIEGETRAVVRTIPVGKRPRGIHLSSDGRQAFVAVSGSPRMAPGADPQRAKLMTPDKSADGIAIVTLSGHPGVVRKISVGSDPEEFALSRDGRWLFVSNEDEGTLSCWEIANGRAVFRTAVSEEPEGVTLHPTRNEVYVTCEERGEVFVVDSQNGMVIARLSTGGRPRTIAFTPDGSRAYVPVEGKAEVVVIDASKHAIVRRVSISGAGVMPMGAVASREGRSVFVTTGRGNTVAVLDVASHEVVATIPVGERAWGVALSPDGTLLYTANGASNDVSVVDVSARKELARIKVGDGPWGIVVAAGEVR